MNKTLGKLTPQKWARVLCLLLAAIVCSAAGKPTVSLDESCRRATAVVVVEQAADAGTYRVLDVLHDGTRTGLKKDAVMAVDLKGMVYDKGKAYILFLESVPDAGRYQAVPQVRTEDGKESRERVRKVLAEIKAK